MCLCVSVCLSLGGGGVKRGAGRRTLLALNPGSHDPALYSTPLCPSKYPSASLPLTVLPSNSLVLTSGPLHLLLPLPGTLLP